ncbi:hypothetical protein HWV62_2647 [Athelia sp. TMB]|nr:hypothetical protein HWV62_2647 [Athelia sp. TMB]
MSEGGFVPDPEEPMDEDGNQMESDDLTPLIPRKRSRSPTASIATSMPEAEATHTRIPKRQRRNKDVPDYHAPVEALSISRNNPMSRKVLKKEAKKARRDATRLHKANVGGGMDVDSDGSALQFTFMATTEGISF